MKNKLSKTVKRTNLGKRSTESKGINYNMKIEVNHLPSPYSFNSRSFPLSCLVILEYAIPTIGIEEVL